MDVASLTPEALDKSAGRLLKALVFSAALHLALILLIQPARQAGDDAEVIIQARIAALPSQTAPHAPTLVEDAPLVSAPQAAEASPQPMISTTPGPAQAEAVPPAPMTDAGVGMPELSDQAAAAETDASTAAASAPSSALPEIPVMLDTRWHTARQVDRRPEIKMPALPVYPEEARRHGIEGSVVVEVHIDEFGHVREMVIVEANPPGVFDTAVLDAYGNAHYSPAILDGRPVRYIGRYRVLFELD